MLRSYEYNTNENDFQQDSDSSCVSLTVEILAKLKKGCFCSLIAVGGCYQLPDNSIGVELRGCPVSPVPAKGSSSLLRVGKHGGWPGDTRWVPRCPAPSPEPRPLPGLQQELLPLHAFSRHLQLSSARPSCCTASQWHSYPKSSEKVSAVAPLRPPGVGMEPACRKQTPSESSSVPPCPFPSHKGRKKVVLLLQKLSRVVGCECVCAFGEGQGQLLGVKGSSQHGFASSQHRGCSSTLARSAIRTQNTCSQTSRVLLGLL